MRVVGGGYAPQAHGIPAQNSQSNRERGAWSVLLLDDELLNHRDTRGTERVTIGAVRLRINPA